jgi:hypothetical protein
MFRSASHDNSSIFARGLLITLNPFAGEAKFPDIALFSLAIVWTARVVAETTGQNQLKWRHGRTGDLNTVLLLQYINT